MKRPHAKTQLPPPLPDDGHKFDDGPTPRCEADSCGLWYHDYLMLRGASDKPVPCPYISEVLAPSEDGRINR